jgi:hypothetical protein
MNMKRASNLHSILNLSSKITNPLVGLTRGFDKGAPVKVSPDYSAITGVGWSLGTNGIPDPTLPF